jgi:hypothetical protein
LRWTPYIADAQKRVREWEKKLLIAAHHRGLIERNGHAAEPWECTRN